MKTTILQQPKTFQHFKSNGVEYIYLGHFSFSGTWCHCAVRLGKIAGQAKFVQFDSLIDVEWNF